MVKSIKKIEEQLSALRKERDESIEYSKFMKKEPYSGYSYLDVHLYSLKDVIYEFGKLSSILKKDVFSDSDRVLSTIPQSVLVPLKVDETYFTKKYYFFLRPLSSYIEKMDLTQSESVAISSSSSFRKYFKDAVIFLEDRYKKEISELEEKVTDKYIMKHFSTHREFVSGVQGDGFRQYYKPSYAETQQHEFQKRLGLVKGKLEILEYFAK